MCAPASPSKLGGIAEFDRLQHVTCGQGDDLAACPVEAGCPAPPACSARRAFLLGAGRGTQRENPNAILTPRVSPTLAGAVICSKTVSREAWSAVFWRPGHGECSSPVCRTSHQRFACQRPGACSAADRVCVRGDGRSGLIGRLHDRGVAAVAAWPSRAAAGNADHRAGDHRAGRCQLLAAGRAVPAGRRLGRGGGAGVRDGLGLLADRRADRGFRADDYDLHRGGCQRADRLRAGARPRPGSCSAWPCWRSSRA